MKNASGLYNLMRNLGGAVGLALINTVATSRLAVHTLHWQEQVTWARPGAMGRHHMTHAMTPAKAGNAHLAALKQLAVMVQQQALTLAYNDVLLLMALAFLGGAAADAAAGEAVRRRGGGALAFPFTIVIPPARAVFQAACGRSADRRLSDKTDAA